MSEPVTILLFVFIVVSTSRVKGLRSEDICELLEHERTSEFSNFTESENSNVKFMITLLLIQFAKKVMQIYCWIYSC